MDRYCEFFHKNRYISIKDLNNYFRIDDLLSGLTDNQKSQLRANIGAASSSIADTTTKITFITERGHAYSFNFLTSPQREVGGSSYATEPIGEWEEIADETGT